MPASFSRRAFLISAVAGPAATRLLPAQDARDTTFTADVRVVNLFATVRDKQGRIVRDLNQDDFVLEEDGRPQVIRYFSRESNLPLTLGLLVDTSGSMRRVLGEERTASYRFLDQVLQQKDQAFVIHFDREVELLQDLTSSRKKLENALAELEQSQPQRPSGQWGGGRRGGYGGGRRGGGGGTSLYDAVLLASDEVMKKQSGRKALVLLTDGVDNGSKVPLARAVEAAQMADTLVYGIRIADPDGYNFGRRRGGMSGRGAPPPYVYGDRLDGKKILQRLCQPTGGASFDVSEKQPIDAIYTQLQEELRNQYSLGYTPDHAAAGPGYRRIHLAVKRDGVNIQTRDGYYAAS
ncbi:MAG TPA: VWA domain-containing protein [Bryobacteraceae bacterium]|nr:VWA domain-containing protein [Bryobacteraceae bacterium]